MTLEQTLLTLTKQLYPEGRAFKMPAGSMFERLHEALNVSDATAYEGATSILWDIIPDNNYFTAEDATQWERRLGIITNTDASLADRKAGIIQKMAYPGTVRPRGSYTYLQEELRRAGYDVYVYENRFFPGPVTKTPSEILGITAGMAELDMFELDEVELDETWSDSGITLCVNYIEEAKDEEFVIGDNYRSTFYIAGATITTFANVDVNRKDQFRQLILQLKPAQTVGILFVNYV